MSEKTDELEALLADDPHDPDMHFMLGRAYFDEGEFGPAAREMEEVLTLKPDFPAAHRWLGNAYEKLGRTDDAIRTYEQGIEVSERSGWLQPSKEMRVFLRRLIGD